MSSRDKRKQQIKRKGTNVSKEPHKNSQKQRKNSISKQFFGEDGLFGSNRIYSNHSRKQQNQKQLELITKSHKVITTDQSNYIQSKIHESIFYCENKEPNEQYFQSITLKERKMKPSDSQHSSSRSSKLKDLSCKLKQMQKLVLSQDKEIAELKGSISEKELHRLIKMHSIERLKVVSAIKIKPPSSKKSK